MFDSQTIFHILMIAVLGGIIGLDRTAVGQFMVSQPIVAGPLTGWILGDVTAGFVIGAALELIWVLDMPVGAFVPADSTIATISAVALSALGSQGQAPLSLIGFSILLTAGMAPLTMFADGLVRKRNARLFELATAGPGEDAVAKLSKAHLSGLVAFFLKSFLLYLLILPTGLVLLTVFGYLPDRVHGAMTLFVKFLPALGAALIARKLSIKVFDRFLLIGFLTAATAGLMFHAPAYVFVMLSIVAGWIGVKYSEKRSA